MKCSSCKKESTWLEIIGSEFICKNCINKHKIIGVVFRTHIDTFRMLLKKAEIKNYNELMNLKRQDIEKFVDLKKQKIYLKTTNVIDIE